MPDVSHLTEAERAVLQDVWRRQREEEEKLRDVNRYASLNLYTYLNAMRKDMSV